MFRPHELERRRHTEAVRSRGARVSYTRLLWGGALTGMVVVVANAIVRFVFSAFGVMPGSVEIPSTREPLPLRVVIDFSLVPVFLAAVFY